MIEVQPFEPGRGYSPDHPYTTERDVELDSITQERMEHLREIARRRASNATETSQNTETPLE